MGRMKDIYMVTEQQRIDREFEESYPSFDQMAAYQKYLEEEEMWAEREWERKREESKQEK